MTVDTRKVTGRRKLKFASYDEILADAERLVQGPTRQLGNWTVGQALEHLARAQNMAIDGSALRLPWAVRLVVRTFLKKRLIDGPMPSGFKLPADAAKVLEPAATSPERGLESYRASVARLARDSRREPSPTLGALSLEEYDRLHFSHAALHLSFFVPK